MRLDDHPIFCDSDFMLLHDDQPTFAQLVQRVLIDLFQKPNARRIQNSKSAANNRLGEPIDPALISVHPWLKYLAVSHASQPRPVSGWTRCSARHPVGKAVPARQIAGART
jgi:hypothetical protein